MKPVARSRLWGGWLVGLPAVLFFLTPTTLAAADWYSYRGPEQDGVSHEKDLPAKFSLDPKEPDSNLIWKADFRCRSTPIVMNGRVYINNSAGSGVMEQERVMCLDANSGKKIWEHRFGVWHTDIVSVRLGWTHMVGDPKTGNVYWHGAQGLLIGFDKDGKILWKHSMTEEFGRISGYGGRLSSPMIDEDLVIFSMLNFSFGSQAVGANRLVAMNKHDGHIVWWWESKQKPKDTISSIPVVAVINGQRVLVFGSGDGYLFAVKARTGEELWSYHITEGGLNNTVVVDGNRVYCSHGAENVHNNYQGGIFCFDASEVKDGKPKLVWEKFGIPSQFAAPLLRKGRLYVAADNGRLHCLDAKTGNANWKKPLIYGRTGQGAPVWGDGKIFLGAVDGTFSIIEDTGTKGKILHKQEFPSPDGVTDVEITSTPAIANGRVYFGTSEGTYCIGKKDHSEKAGSSAPLGKENPVGEPASIRIEPAEVALLPGEKAHFFVRVLDANGRVLKDKNKAGSWTAPTPPPPPRAKAKPPALKGKIASPQSGECILNVDDKLPQQEGLLVYENPYGKATARIRVAPRLPYAPDFSKVTVGLVPGGWINAQGKFTVVKLKDGTQVLKNNNKVGSPLVARANCYISPPDWKNYTIEADIMGTKVDKDLPDMGVNAHRYRLVLFGNLQQLKIDAWDQIPRVSVSVPFQAEAGVWYRFKLKVEVKGDKGYLYGKAWKRDEQEPMKWLLEFTDPNPIPSGSAALYSYSTAILEDRPGTEVFFNNVRITPNGADSKK
jgi:outer membrane protein assembly factor BamB